MFLLLCIFLSPAPLSVPSLFHVPYSLCIFPFFIIPFFPFLPGSQKTSSCRFSQKQGAKPAFLVLSTLPLYCIYHTNTGCVITRALSLNTQIRKDTVAAKMNFRVSLVGDVFLHLSGEESTETEELSRTAAPTFHEHLPQNQGGRFLNSATPGLIKSPQKRAE